MRKRTVGVITLGVWIAGLGSAAALTYDANRPARIAGTGAQVDAPSDTAGAVPLAPEPVSVLFMPEATIVGKAPPTRAGGRP